MKNIILICSFLTCTFIGVAQNGIKLSEGDIKELQAQLETKAEQTNSIKADFKQKKHLRIFKDPVESRGQLFYQKPKRILWSYDEPADYKVLISGETIKTANNGKLSEFNISASNQFSQINQLLFHAVSGNIIDQDIFQTEILLEGENYIIKLDPISEELKKYIDLLKIVVVKDQMDVRRVILYESEVDFTEIDFLNKETNANLDEAIFTID